LFLLNDGVFLQELRAVTTGKAVTSDLPLLQNGSISPRIISLYGYDFLAGSTKAEEDFQFFRLLEIFQPLRPKGGKQSRIFQCCLSVTNKFCIYTFPPSLLASGLHSVTSGWTDGR
jgi:hypothetical protein